MSWSNIKQLKSYKGNSFTYDGAGMRLSKNSIQYTYDGDRLLKEDRRRLISAMIKAAPDRLHTLMPGLAILEAVAARFDCVCFAASPYGVREGYLLHMLEGETEYA